MELSTGKMAFPLLGCFKEVWGKDDFWEGKGKEGKIPCLLSSYDMMLLQASLGLVQ